jgi:ABC-type phosphate/phosphonate transport system permease subunit
MELQGEERKWTRRKIITVIAIILVIIFLRIRVRQLSYPRQQDLGVSTRTLLAFIPKDDEQ